MHGHSFWPAAGAARTLALPIMGREIHFLMPGEMGWTNAAYSGISLFPLKISVSHIFRRNSQMVAIFLSFCHITDTLAWPPVHTNDAA